MKVKPKISEGESLVTRVRRALEGVPRVQEKKMFGSVGFMVRGRLCVGAREERIMCRIAPEVQAELIQREGCQTVMMRGRPCRGYVYVASEVLGSERALKAWLELALDYNRRQPSAAKT